MANGWKPGRPCEMPVAKIAGLAGVCHTLGQEAMRFMRDGPGRIGERRQAGRANLPNSVEIIEPEWQTWIELRRQGADLDRSFEPAQRERGALRKISLADSNAYRPESIRNDSAITEQGQHTTNCPLGSLTFAPPCRPDAPQNTRSQRSMVGTASAAESQGEGGAYFNCISHPRRGIKTPGVERGFAEGETCDDDGGPTPALSGAQHA
jgi:hypothetical protein